MFNALKVAIRGLLRRPSFTLAAVGTLAVGIGAVTAVFSAVNATVLRPLPYDNPEDLYVLTQRFIDGRWTSGRVASAYVFAAAEAPSVVSAVSLTYYKQIVLSDDGGSRQVLTQEVGEGFFDLFGLEMAAGRGFLPEDYTFTLFPTAAIISDRLWAEMFGRDPDVVGRTLDAHLFDATIVGVAPREFDVPRDTDVWYAESFNSNGAFHNSDGYLRVIPGTTPERLEEELTAVMLGVVERLPDSATGRALVATGLNDAIVGDLRPILFVLFAGSALLLLLGCANVVTLFLGRGVARTKELAVSSASGATRARLAWQFLAEALVVSVLGMLAGTLVAFLGIRAMLVLGASRLPRLADVSFDVRVFAFLALVLVTVSLLVGLLPAIRLSDTNVRDLLGESRGASSGRGARRLLSGLVVCEIALGVVLLCGAGWIARGFGALADTDPGFDPEQRLTFEAFLEGSSYAEMPRLVLAPEGDRYMLDPEWVFNGLTPSLWIEGLSERLKATGQVTAVGAANTMPLGPEWDVGFFVAASEVDYDPARQETVQSRPVSVEFFDAMGIRLLAGRPFTADDGSFETAIVNQEFVRLFLNGRDPVGASLYMGYPTVTFENPIQIVGVVEDVRYGSLGEPPGPIFYTPLRQGRLQVVIATSSEDPLSLASAIRAAAEELDPSIPIEVRSLEQMVDDQLLSYRLGLVLMSLFAGLSLVMATVGIYGMVAHSTAQRSRELATRMSLGATGGGLTTLVVSEGGLLAALGVGIGLATAYAGGRILANRLYGIEAGDPVVLVGAAATVLAMVLLAYLIPAVRAAQLRPATALKAE